MQHATSPEFKKVSSAHALCEAADATKHGILESALSLSSLDRGCRAIEVCELAPHAAQLSSQVLVGAATFQSTASTSLHGAE